MTRPAGSDPSAPVEPFDLGEWWGEAVTRLGSMGSWAQIVARLVDPGEARRTIHWGRNYLYETRIDSPDGPIDVVVKQVRNQGWRNRQRRRLGGSKAMRSWRMARAFMAAGVPTAEPLAVIESAEAEGPAFFRHAAFAGRARSAPCVSGGERGHPRDIDSEPGLPDVPR